MVVAVATPAVSQILLRPFRLSPSIPSYTPFGLPHYSSLSTTFHFKSHHHNGSSSSMFLISNIHCSSPSSLNVRQRFKPVAALGSDLPHPIQPEEETAKAIKQWDCWTAKFAAAANIPFLILQLPQILLNARNLTAGNYSALSAVNWLGSLTGLLANLSLLSYFAKKKEREAMIIQCLGVVTTYIVITQLEMAGAMPFPYFFLTSLVVGTGLISNFLNYCGMLPSIIWDIWEDFITVGGLSVLPQVMWSTFVPYIPNSMLPGVVSFALAMVAVVMVSGSSLGSVFYSLSELLERTAFVN